MFITREIRIKPLRAATDSMVNLYQRASGSIVIAITSLFNKLPYIGDIEVIFPSSSQAATCPPQTV